MVDNVVDARNTGGVLAIETSSDACSVAFRAVDGRVSEDHRELPRGHHHALLPMIDALLARHETTPRSLVAIVLGAGPGSFTGLRIGASVAQALALAASCPIVAVSSLLVLAAGTDDRVAASAETVITAQPARPGELYVGVYRRTSSWGIELPDRVTPVARLHETLLPFAVVPAIVAGRGADTVLDAMGTSVWRRSASALPRAAVALEVGLPLLESGGGTDAAHLELNYVSDTSAWRKA
jgi:tRNA threonylcarbamoyladenosine biosynthesis protein TsaB